jgi:hypothetical protein
MPNRILLDLGPVRKSRDFRLLFGGQLMAVVGGVLRSTILQRTVDEAFRSRLSALQIAVVEGGPRLGDLEAGVVANLASVEFSIIAGGLACLAGAALLVGLLPGFRRYVHPSQERLGVP